MRREMVRQLCSRRRKAQLGGVVSRCTLSIAAHGKDESRRFRTKHVSHGAGKGAEYVVSSLRGAVFYSFVCFILD